MKKLFKNWTVWDVNGFALGLGMLAIMSIPMFHVLTSARAENTITTKRPSVHPASGRVGTVEKGHIRTVQRGGDADFTCWADADGDGEVIPWYSLVTWHCPSPGGVVCLSMTIDGATVDVAATGVVTDTQTVGGGGADGAGTCFWCSGYFSQTLSKGIYLDPNAILRATGVCVDSGSDPTGAPCRADSECDTSESETCDIASNHLTGSSDITGAYTCWRSGVVSYVTAE